MTIGRRRFLQAMFGAACGVVIADDVLEVLDVVAPRPVLVPGADLVGVRAGASLDAMVDLQALVHEVFIGEVLPQVKWQSVTAQIFVGGALPGRNFSFDVAPLAVGRLS